MEHIVRPHALEDLAEGGVGCEAPEPLRLGRGRGNIDAWHVALLERVQRIGDHLGALRIEPPVDREHERRIDEVHPEANEQGEALDKYDDGPREDGGGEGLEVRLLVCAVAPPLPELALDHLRLVGAEEQAAEVGSEGAGEPMRGQDGLDAEQRSWSVQSN